ncbi:hypothetical protein PFH69_000404 [Klebsiella oxytoca]|nr:hypothetical protein [Klebsiella oxytoca]
MTSKLTREWLKHQISAIEAVGITDSNTLAAFKLALAAMDSEPAARMVVIPTIWKHYTAAKTATIYEKAMTDAGIEWRSIDD